MVVALATWCATHDVEAAAVVTGHLDAHHVGGGHHTVDETRATVMAQPDAERWLAHGSQLDRDQLVAYILDRYEAGR